MVYSQQAVQNLLTLHQPTRIALLVRTKAPIYSCSPDEIVQTACDTLGIPVAEAVPTLLVVDKWNKLDVFVFDVYHVNYDPETAHRMCVLPVVLVDYSRQATTIKLAHSSFQHEVNRGVANAHDYNGWDAKKPYIADHTGTNVPTYYSPRSMTYSTT